MANELVKSDSLSLSKMIVNVNRFHEATILSYSGLMRLSKAPRLRPALMEASLSSSQCQLPAVPRREPAACLADFSPACSCECSQPPEPVYHDALTNVQRIFWSLHTGSTAILPLPQRCYRFAQSISQGLWHGLSQAESSECSINQTTAKKAKDCLGRHRQ